MPPASPRLLFIGLDAMDPDMALQWVESGDLPNLRNLLQRAVSGSTYGPDGFYVGGIWPSISTSSTPARHGQYCWMQFDPDTYLEPRPPYDDGDAEPFWLALDRAGKRVAIFDLPRTIYYPEFGGLQIHDWGMHDPLPPRLITSPPALSRELRQKYGPALNYCCNDWERVTLRDHRNNLEKLGDRIRLKARIARDLMAREPWDLFALGFGDSHCVGHQYWHLHDTQHALHDAAVRKELEDPYLHVYRNLDAALGEILGAAGSETRVIVLLSHGIGPHYDGSHILDAALERIARKLPHGRSLNARERIMQLRGSRKKASRGYPRRLWRRYPERMFRTVFQVQNNEAFAGIRFNLAGREPLGRIRPEELDAFAAAVTGELLELRNPATERPAFRRVLRTAEIYEGPRLHLLPDLLAEWDRARVFDALESPTVGRVEGIYDGVRTGDHLPGGFFAATGPGWPARRLEDRVSVMDFGPTLAQLLDVPLPGVDGRPISALAQPPLEGT